jgi:signal transduction histidine kinase
MKRVLASPKRFWKEAVKSNQFWAVAFLLVATALLHYLTPQSRLLPAPVNTFLSRHAVERIIFVLPVAVAASAFRWRGGVLTLALAVIVMLPRAICISVSPADALIEIAAAAAVGSLVIWMIESQIREKELHQEAISRLSAINAITAIVSQSLELEDTLNATLDKILEVVGMEAGLMFRIDKRSQELVLAVSRGVSEESTLELERLNPGQHPCGRAAESGELAMIQDASSPPAMRREGLRLQVAVPLKSTDRVQGVLVVASRQMRQFLPEELALLTAIGNAIGVAIENARLYENMRFYVREITRAQEDERQRIAHELHDETVQMLIVLSRRLEALVTASEPLSETTRHHIRSLQELIPDISGGIRRFVRDLRPPTLDHLGLVATIEGLARDLEKDQIEARVRAKGEVKRLASEEELVLFRIAQEALSNARRHSGASQVTVRLSFCDDRIQMEIADNGCGFPVPERIDDLVSMGRLGLAGMYERARTLDGTLAIHSAPGQGTVVTADIPVRPRSQSEGSHHGS